MSLVDEHGRRLERFRDQLRKLGLDGALLVHATDVFYLTGTRQNAVLWLPTAGVPVLLVRKSLARAQAEAAVGEVRPFPRSKELPAVLGEARRVGVTFDVAPVSVVRFYERALPGVELADVSAPLREVRSVKSAFEIDRMRETAHVACSVISEVPTFLAEGMREIDLSAEIEYRMRRAGNEGSPRVRAFNQEFFGGVVVSGESAVGSNYFDGPITGRGLSPACPVGPSTAVIPRDVPVLLDYTAIKNGYVVDLTRLVVLGKLATDLQRAFAVALAIQHELARALKPGAIPSKLFEAAQARAEREGLGRHFMGPPGDQARFVGHGVGLELDELPVLAPGFDAPLVEGQTIAVEPKFVIPGRGAVGIENTWAVGRDGGVKLTDMDDAMMRVE